MKGTAIIADLLASLGGKLSGTARPDWCGGALIWSKTKDGFRSKRVDNCSGSVVERNGYQDALCYRCSQAEVRNREELAAVKLVPVTTNRRDGAR